MKFLGILIILIFSTFSVFSHEVDASNKYVVKSGDTLWIISNKFHIDLETLIKENRQVSNPNLIFPGETINIPDQISSSKMKDMESSLLHLLNNERIKKGLSPLKLDPALSLAAKRKSEDMRSLEYVAHTSPTYGDPNEMLSGLNISFHTVKENIGAGHQTPDEVFDAWRNSPVHRNNYLDKTATLIGIGYAKGGLHGDYWTVFVINRVD